MKKHNLFMKYKRIFGAIIISFFVFFYLETEVYAENSYSFSNDDEELIVVLDPGHGGENLGADYNGYIEKEMNMIVANAMYEELSKYEGITVYMTRTGDVETDISLKDRAKIAKEVNADYLFCLHFNMSAENNFYGSEVWIQSRGQENRDGYVFAGIQLQEMKELGLFIRGIKTRLNDKGTDYYGILRQCKEYGIPAVLIEHCHVDNDTDVVFCDTKEELEAFGKADATAVAKYFGLTSKELGVDYSDYEVQAVVEKDTEYVDFDTTPPEVSILYLEECDYEKRKVTLKVTGRDGDTPMLYYAYSVDGGETFSDCFPWPEADMLTDFSPESFDLTVDIEPGLTPVIVTRVYNKYDKYTDSNILTGFSKFPEEISATQEETGTEEKSTESIPAEEKNMTETEVSGEAERNAGGEKLLLYLTAAACILLIVLVEIAIIKPRRNKKQK